MSKKGIAFHVRLDKELENFASKPLSLLDVAGFFGEELLNETKDSFKKQEDPNTGKKWQPLKNPAKKKRASSIGKILVDEGDLLRQIDYEATARGSLIVGSPLVYSRVHQNGFAKYSIPARSFLGMSKKKIETLLVSDKVHSLLGIA
ncbi:MAG: phage virion morphogenesis protein [Treponemataceae bacterium]